jgi:G:T-mismatch repair DNA endonuclease (very short patch repair protein)
VKGVTQRSKLIDHIKNAKTADFDNIHQLLTQLGFNWRANGSHYTYTKDPYVIGIVRHGQQVKTVYLRNVQDLLDQMGL